MHRFREREALRDFAALAPAEGLTGAWNRSALKAVSHREGNCVPWQRSRTPLDASAPSAAQRSALSAFMARAKPGWKVCAVVFLVGVAVRFAAIFLTHSYRHVEDSEIVRVATSLAHTGRFADAFGPHTGPTAHVAPLYPLLMSVMFRLFGTGVHGSLAMELLSCTLASVSYALLPLYAFVLPRFSTKAAAIGGLLGALLPINRWVQAKGTFEYALSALLFTVVSLIILAVWKENDFSTGSGLAIGFSSGVLLLTAPQFAPILVVLGLVPLFLYKPDRSGRYIRYLAVQAVVVLLCLSPWIYRNWRVMGSPVWGRSNAGMELWLSNNDSASPDWDTNDRRGLFAAMHPSNSITERNHEMAVGEVAYNREKLHIAVAWMKAHPSRLARLTVERAVLFCFPKMTRWTQSVALGLITLLGAVGLVLYFRKGEAASYFFPATWAVMLLCSCMFQQSGRMRYPIEWSTYLFSGYLLAQVSVRLFRGRVLQKE